MNTNVLPLGKILAVAALVVLVLTIFRGVIPVVNSAVLDGATNSIQSNGLVNGIQNGIADPTSFQH